MYSDYIYSTVTILDYFVCFKFVSRAYFELKLLSSPLHTALHHLHHHRADRSQIIPVITV